MSETGAESNANNSSEAIKTLFKSVKFFITGEIKEEFIEILKNGGAERLNYLSDYVTHLIVGENFEENDITDAYDLYEIPAIIPKWILMCQQLNTIVNTKPYLYNTQKLFSNLKFCLSKCANDFLSLWGIITYFGGEVHLKLNRKCTHLITTDLKSPKGEKAMLLGPEVISIVTPDWILEAVKNKTLPDVKMFHPKLINWPKPVPPAERTTAITGFEETSTVEEVATEETEKNEDDSTQALLEKLKQRMPRNQTETPVLAPISTLNTNMDIVAPPNVVAPSFLSKNQNQIRTITSQQQTMQQQQQPQAVQSASNLPVTGLNQSQGQQNFVQQQAQQQVNRLNQQQIRQQLGLNNQNPIHQQLLLQRIQQNPNLLQRTSGGQIVQSQQQILQQLNQQQQQQQQQRQLLQNQMPIQGQVTTINQHQQLNAQQRTQQLSQDNQLLQNQLNQPQQQLLQQQKLQFKQQLMQQKQLQQQQLQQQQLQQQQLQQQQQQQQPQQVQSFNNQNQILSSQNQQQQQLLQQKMFNQQQQQQQQQNINPNLIIQSQQPQQFNQNFQQQQIVQGDLNQTQAQSSLNQQQMIMQQQQQLILQQQQQINQPINQQIGQQQQIASNITNYKQPQLLQQSPVSNSIPQQPLSQPQIQQQGNLGQQQLIQSPQMQQQPAQLNQNLDPNLAQQNIQFQQVQQPQQNIQQVLNPQLMQQQMQGGGMLQQRTQQIPQQQQQQIWQQQQQQQQQQLPGQPQQVTVRHPGPRIQWSTNQPGVPQRQYIQLDAQTHNQLQKMPPEQRALFVQRLQKQRQQIVKHVQQRAGGSHILIRAAIPPGLNQQQQMQWLQQHARQGIVLPPNIQQQNIAQGTNVTQKLQHAPGLSPIQNNPQFVDQNQMHLHQFKLQQLQLQREQAQKNQMAQQPQQPVIPQQQPNIRPMVAETIPPPTVVQDGTVPVPSITPTGVQPPLVVNAKTKAALSNMLSIKLQSGGSSAVGPRPEVIPEPPSAAGTLRLMTAQHNAALNSAARPQELIALQHRQRIVNGPNGEIIRGPAPVIAPQNEPPKLQYHARPSASVQHRPGPFYGHNPNLKLPPDLFLLGCIFVVVEIDRLLDEQMPGWQQKIEKHGGEVEKQYCNRVTHVLCETQRHGVVMQALRDFKRCVTLFWLSDVMKRKQVLPPWAALHLPTIYLDTTPASKHLISITGFTGNERCKVKKMITYTGAKFTAYFSRHNTLLIAAKAEGQKYNHAKKWNIPVVNLQWLTDIMLGNFAAMNQMEQQVYQQFPTPPNFSFDPKLVPNLMSGWKMPINISQESYERVKRSASPSLLPVKTKKQKTNETDENDNINTDQEMADVNYRILFSMCSNVKELKNMVKDLGGCLADNYEDCTHLVMPQLARTNKLLFSLCRGVYIVPEQWLRDSHSSSKFLPENNYSFDTKLFNSEYRCDFAQTLTASNKRKLLEGRFFFVTPSVFPSKKIICKLIELCGGVIERIRRSASQIEATNLNSPYSYIIITHEKDLHLVADLLKNKKEKVKIVCNAELIFSAILKQIFEVDPFAVKVL